MNKLLQSGIEILLLLITFIIVWYIIRYPHYIAFTFLSFIIILMVLHIIGSSFLELMLLLSGVLIGVLYTILLPQQTNEVYRISVIVETCSLVFCYIVLLKLDQFVEKRQISYIEKKEELEKELSLIKIDVEDKHEEIYNNLVKIQNYKAVETIVNRLQTITSFEQIKKYVIEIFTQLFPKSTVKLYFEEQSVDTLDKHIINIVQRDIVYIPFVTTLSDKELPIEIKNLFLQQNITSFVYFKLSKHQQGKFPCIIIYSKSQITEEQFMFISLILSYITVAIANIELFNRTKELAITDSLTGLYTQKYFKELLYEQMKFTRYYKKNLSLAIFDIDNFKQINDTYGHNIGDEVLKRFSNVLRQRLRETDIIARYGGDEFAVIFPNTDVSNAKKICEEIRTLVAKETLVVTSAEVYKKVGGATSRIHFFISCGVGEFSEKFSTVEEFIDYVDTRLYQAKQTGKNKVIA